MGALDGDFVLNPRRGDGLGVLHSALLRVDSRVAVPARAVP